MNLKTTEFKRKFSMSMYKTLRLSMAEMSFAKDFVNDTRGDLYPLLRKDEGTAEHLADHRYHVSGGTAARYFCQYFPYATYEAVAVGQRFGFVFRLPHAEATVELSEGQVVFCGSDGCKSYPMPAHCAA